jgi:hypothetical protein
MKKRITVVFVASLLMLAGCTTPHATKWEYKVTAAPNLPRVGGQEQRDADQAFLNDLGKDGWVLTSQSDGRVFYFRRPIR